jgi:TRAP-type C4-dicarboxylate transport system permease small subunit
VNDDNEQKTRLSPAGLLSALSSNGLMVIACAGVTLMMLHVTADVIGKYLFSASMPATYETVQMYYMVALVFLPFSYVARGEGHIFVELFSRNLSPRRRSAMDASVGLLTLVWVCLLGWYAGEEAVTTTIDGELQETAGGYLLVWPSRWFIPAGCAAMALAVVIKLSDDVKQAMSINEASEDPDPR